MMSGGTKDCRSLFGHRLASASEGRQGRCHWGQSLHTACQAWCPGLSCYRLEVEGCQLCHVLLQLLSFVLPVPGPGLQKKAGARPLPRTLFDFVTGARLHHLAPNSNTDRKKQHHCPGMNTCPPYSLITARSTPQGNAHTVKDKEDFLRDKLLPKETR